MLLKSLELHGFKSFADDIKLEFGAGKTAVVGPNGSGKSNISDAVRWVLGEQSIKSLRGSKMEDIIFAGTEFRKPVGFAEVKLTIDNTESILPIEFSEITIARRLYRSGESEYLINNANCRLKDIYELFYDTGLGREGYSIIGQGKIDEILSAKAEDRRNIFEEASGIMKFKTRKAETEKKLEQTRVNITRISDIVNELEVQLGPLKDQYETAKKFLQYRDELKVLEINIFITNIEKYKQQLKDIDRDADVITDNIESENRRLEKITSKNQSNIELNRQYESDYARAREECFRIDLLIDNCAAAIKLNQEKIMNRLSNIERFEEENADRRMKIVDFDKFVNNRNSRIQSLEKQLSDYAGKMAKAESDMAGFLRELDENGVHIEKMKAGIMDSMDAILDKKTVSSNINASIENIDKRKVSINREIEQNVSEIDKYNIENEDINDAISGIKKSITEKLTRVNALDNSKDKSVSELDTMKKQRDELKTENDHKISRLKILREMENRMEGYGRSVKAVTEKCKANPEFGKGIFGTIAQIIETDVKYETAIEMALGPVLQNIVTETEEEAKRAIRYLKEDKIGRATFLPISTVSEKGFEKNRIEKIREIKGFCGIASELVRFDEKFSGVIGNMLGRVVIIDNIDNAAEAARKFDHSIKIVTLEGDVFSPGGAITGGSRENTNVRLLGRKREIDGLEKEIADMRESEEKHKKIINELATAIMKIDSEIESSKTSLRQFETDKRVKETQLLNVAHNMEATQKRMDSQKSERDNIEIQKVTLVKDAAVIKGEIALIEKELEETKRVIVENQEKYKEHQDKRDALLNETADFKISMNSIKETLANMTDELVKFESENKGMLSDINKNAQLIEDNKKNVSELEIGSLELENSISEHKSQKTSLESETEHILLLRSETEENIQNIINDLNSSNKAITLLKDDYSRIEIKKARLEAETESLKNKLWDEYQLTYTNAADMKREVGPVNQAQKRINELKQMIMDLGPININAIEDYIKTKERYEFLMIQMDDVEKSAEKLVRIIGEISAIMRIQFAEQFKLINESFSDVFSELFDGGKAKLVLDDENNILECGIEIHVQPPGKKLQNMLLFSGGEKALTAIALLFAIFRLKPSPFCILDEIEASLDEANVYKFAEFMMKLPESTQYILITHKKGTMEICDTIYGVTMEEKGISKIVSMKMEERAS